MDLMVIEDHSREVPSQLKSEKGERPAKQPREQLKYKLKNKQKNKQTSTDTKLKFRASLACSGHIKKVIWLSQQEKGSI